MEEKTQSLLPQLSELILDAVFLVNADGEIVYVSGACQRIFGYTPEEMIGRSMIELVAPMDRDKTLEEAKRVMSGHPRIGFENRYIRKDGRMVDIMWSARWSEADQLRVGVARDITERKYLEQMQAVTYAVSEAAHRSNDLASLCLEIHQIIENLVPVSVFAVATYCPTSKQFSYIYQKDDVDDDKTSSTHESIISSYCAEVMETGQLILRHDEAIAGHSGQSFSLTIPQCWMALPLITRQEATGALIMKSRHGTIYSSKDKELLRFTSVQIATAIDRKRLSIDLLRTARYDELTGLPNRRLFHDRIKSVLARCKRNQSRMALLFIDLDHFKKINDSYGHSVGDLLLREVAQRLRRCVRTEDTVFRFGGDEFVVMMEELLLPEDTLSLTDRIREILGGAIPAGDLMLHAQASIGTSVYPEQGSDTDQLLKHADKEMYLNKEKRKLARAF